MPPELSLKGKQICQTDKGVEKEGDRGGQRQSRGNNEQKVMKTKTRENVTC